MAKAVSSTPRNSTGNRCTYIDLSEEDFAENSEVVGADEFIGAPAKCGENTQRV